MRPTPGINTEPSGSRGVALITVLLILVVLTGIGAIAINSSIITQTVLGKAQRRVSLEEVAEGALDIFQERLRRRMNFPPPMPKPDGSAWVKDDMREKITLKNGQEELHEYYDATGEQVYKALDRYLCTTTTVPNCQVACSSITDPACSSTGGDFFEENEVSAGIFKPCLKGDGCEESAQWRIYLSDTVHPENSIRGSVSTKGIVDLGELDTQPLDDGGGDESKRRTDKSYQMFVTVEAFDEATGRRIKLHDDFVIAAAYPTKNSSFSIDSNVISLNSLRSGFINGTVSSYVNPGLVPKKGAKYWKVGVPGILNWSCLTNNIGIVVEDLDGDPCQTAWGPAMGYTAFTAGNDRPTLGFADQEFRNMRLKGLISNVGIAGKLGAQSLAGPITGLVIDDGDGATGLASNDALNIPRDAELNVDPSLIETRHDLPFGRESFGGAIVKSMIPDLRSYLNSTGTAELASVDPTTGGLPSKPCIFVNTGSRDVLTPVQTLSSGVHTGNLVLAPHSKCHIKIRGAYMVDGDVIITQGDHAGLVADPTLGPGAFEDYDGMAMRAKLFVTQNLYIAGDVNTKNVPGGSTDAAWDRFAGRTDLNGDGLKDDLDAKAYERAHGTFDELGLIANGNVVIGNLPNRNVYGYIASQATSELAYWGLDLTGDNAPDLLVPDGKHPTKAVPRPLDKDFQVRHLSCGAQEARGFSELPCDSQAPGFLPAGSELVTDRYTFGLTDGWDGAASMQGYVRNPSDPLNDLLGNGQPTPRYPGLDLSLLDPWYETPPPTAPIFGNGSWISDSKFSQIAGARIVSYDPVKASDPDLSKRAAYLLDLQLNQADSIVPANINRAHRISAKVEALGAVLGLGSFDNKYNRPLSAVNPNDPQGGTFPDSYVAVQWPWNNTANVNDPALHPRRCEDISTQAATEYLQQSYTNDEGKTFELIPRGISIFGGLRGRYVNVLSTNGLCVYNDNRPLPVEGEKIFVVRGSGYRQE